MNKENRPYSIAAPVCSLREVEPILKAGANELYFGIMTGKWKEKYGDAEFSTRRQSAYAHFSSFDQLSSLLSIASDFHARTTLVLNAGYSERQLPYVLETVSEWEAIGGHALMLADLELLLRLNEQKSRLARYLSVMAGVFNHESAAFFRRLGVSRVVLPRELTLSEMDSIVAHSEGSMAFEVITLFQKCQYIDSFCHFIHVVEHGSCQPFEKKSGTKLLSLCHGCVLPFHCNGKRVTPLYKNESNTPFCAACRLSWMMEHGIRHFKIAGRGYPHGLIVKAVSFTKNSLETFQDEDQIREGYELAFGKACGNKFCYF